MNADTITMGECIALGLFPSATPVSKMGFVTGVEATEVDIWAVGGTYVFPSAAMQMELVSSGAEDKSNGTGARTVKIWYLDSTFNQKTETVTLNGASGVLTTATDIFRINNFWVMTAGTNGKAAGNIDIRNKTTTTIIYSRIATGQTRARNAAYTVPYGKKLYIWMVSYGASSATGKDVRFTMRTNYNSMDKVLSSLFYPVSEIGLQDNTQPFTYPIPMMFPAGTDIKVSAISSAGAAAICTVQYRGALLS